jgi:hypothetical protein
LFDRIDSLYCTIKGGVMSAGMRTAWERELIGVRANLSADPESALQAAERLVRKAKYNSERVRATLTRGWADRCAGRTELLKDAIKDATRYRRPGDLAASDFAVHYAAYLIWSGDLNGALCSAEEAVELSRPLARSTSEVRGTWKSGSVVRSVVNRAAYAASLTMRAQVRFNLSNRAALYDAFEALNWADPRYVPHVHVAAVSWTGMTLLASGAATPERCAEVLRLSANADRLLARRRVRATSPHRAKIEALRATAFALLGSDELAENLLTRAIKNLKSDGHEKDAAILAEHFIRILTSRGAQEGRARLLASKYGIALPRPKKRAAGPDDDDPIGF